jgi:hypothetical protein
VATTANTSNNSKVGVGQTILVVGDDGAGGLIDTETDTEDEASRRGDDLNKWWESSDLVGLGKDVEVVDIGRMGEDWSRRVGNTSLISGR